MIERINYRIANLTGRCGGDNVGLGAGYFKDLQYGGDVKPGPACCWPVDHGPNFHQ